VWNAKFANILSLSEGGRSIAIDVGHLPRDRDRRGGVGDEDPAGAPGYGAQVAWRVGLALQVLVAAHDRIAVPVRRDAGALGQGARAAGEARSDGGT
jgi:hypothetical protein